MSTYASAKAALLATCRAYNGGATFDTTNSAADDYAVQDTASSQYALVLVKGGPTAEGDNLDGRGSQGMYQERHTFKLIISAKVGNAQQGYGVIIQGLETLVESLKDYIRQHDRLGTPDPVRRAQTIETSATMERVPRDANAPTHFIIEVLVRVFCEAVYPDSEGGY